MTTFPGAVAAAIQKQDIGQGILDGVKCGLVNGLAAVGAQKLGKAYNSENPSLNYFTHKLGHSGLGAE